MRRTLTVTLILGFLYAPAAAQDVRSEFGIAAGRDITGNTITIKGLSPREVRALVDQILSEAGVDFGQVADLAAELGVTQNAVSTFLGILGEENVPTEELTLKLVEIADRHKALLEKIGSVRSQDPEVQALRDEARAAVADGDYARAERLLERAKSALRIDEANRTLLEGASIEAELGTLAFAQFDYAAAAEHFAEAANVVPRSEPLVRASYLNRLGQVLDEAAAYDAAERALEDSLKLREQYAHPNDADLAMSLSDLGALYLDMGRYDEAEPLLKRAVEILEMAHDEPSYNVAINLNALAGLYLATGRYIAAELSYERALSITQAALGRDHPDVAIRLNNLAAVYEVMGRYDEAEPLYQEALEILRVGLSEAHPRFATALNNLAGLYLETGRYEEAKPLLERAMAITETAVGPDHPSFAIRLKNLARLYLDTGRYDEAVPLYHRAIAIDEKAFGPSHPNVAAGLNSLAISYYKMGQFSQAETLLRRVIGIYETRFGPGHPRTREAWLGLATVLGAMAEPAAAK